MRKGFANEIAKISSLLRKFLANGSLRQNLLAIANAMAWCTQPLTPLVFRDQKSYPIGRISQVEECLSVSNSRERANRAVAIIAAIFEAPECLLK